MWKLVGCSLTFALFLYSNVAASSRRIKFSIKSFGAEVKYAKHYTKEYTWRQARQRCLAEGAELLVVEDEAEAWAVRGAVNRVAPDWNIWTGINDLKELGHYQSPDGRPLEKLYSKWVPQQPFSNGDSRRCVVLTPDSLLSVANCDQDFPFICKYPAMSTN